MSPASTKEGVRRAAGCDRARLRNGGDAQMRMNLANLALAFGGGWRALVVRFQPHGAGRTKTGRIDGQCHSFATQRKRITFARLMPRRVARIRLVLRRNAAIAFLRKLPKTEPVCKVGRGEGLRMTGLPKSNDSNAPTARAPGLPDDADSSTAVLSDKAGDPERLDINSDALTLQKAGRVSETEAKLSLCCRHS